MTRLFLCLAVLLTLSACSPDKPEKTKNSVGPESSAAFPPVRAEGLALEIISLETVFHLNGGELGIKFALKNSGLAEIRIPEWKLLESENIDLFYAVCPDGNPENIPEENWKKMSKPEIPGDVPHYPLTLKPKNSVLVELPARFVSNIKKPGVYAIRGELNLSSLKLRTAPRKITIK